MRCRIFLGAGALALVLAGTLLAQDPDPALVALEKFRTDEERKLSDLVAPRPKAPEPWPAGAEVFLVDGYICYDCVRIFRKEGKPLVQRVKMTRSWSYSRQESYAAEQWGVTEDQLREVWSLAERIGSAGLKVHPRPSGPGGIYSSERSFQSSSHEPSVLVRIVNAAGDARFLNVERSKSWSDGVQDLEAIQTRALHKVFESLIPKDLSGEAFPLAEWEPFLVGLLSTYLPDLPAKPGPDRDRPLLVEVSLQLLGQIGGPGALEMVRSASRVEDFREEASRAEKKILLRDHFNAKEAARLIHETGRRLNPDVDFARWLRELYFERDAEGYRLLVAADLQNPGVSSEVLRESIAELGKRYPEQQTSLLEGVLENRTSEVSVEAALTLLQKDPSHLRALETLDRVAGDSSASIPAAADWSSPFGREQALDYLADERKPVPAERRWTLERVERQLQQAWEDGRMVRHLIGTRGILAKNPLPADAQIAAYRRTLNGPITKGTVTACEELIALTDRESADRIAAVLAELAAGQNRGLSWQEDPGAQYPWIDKYGVERVQLALDKLKTSRP